MGKGDQAKLDAAKEFMQEEEEEEEWEEGDEMEDEMEEEGDGEMEGEEGEEDRLKSMKKTLSDLRRRASVARRTFVTYVSRSMASPRGSRVCSMPRKLVALNALVPADLI